MLTWFDAMCVGLADGQHQEGVAMGVYMHGQARPGGRWGREGEKMETYRHAISE